MRRIGSFFVVLFISAGLLGGVANAGTSTAGSVPTVKSLLGKGFASAKVTGNTAIGKRQILVVFSGSSSKPKLTVRGGCNAWRAGFKIRKGRLFLKGQASGTKMGCSKDPDPWIRSKFRKGLKVRTSGSRLTLARPAEGVRFVFDLVAPKKKPVDRIDEVPEPDPDPRVTVPATKEDVDGKDYELIDTIGKKLDRELSLGFRDGVRTDENGDPVPMSNFGFYAGCNHFGGDYRIEDGILSWTDVVSTQMWCHDTDDDWLYAFLTGMPEIGLDGTDLVIRQDGIELQLREIQE